jgi:hypothetical protein
VTISTFLTASLGYSFALHSVSHSHYYFNSLSHSPVSFLPQQTEEQPKKPPKASTMRKYVQEVGFSWSMLFIVEYQCYKLYSQVSCFWTFLFWF